MSVAATNALFETPFPPCNTFQGREVLLGKMEAFFHASLAPMSSQLTFAICGLGTSTVEVLTLRLPSIDSCQYFAGLINRLDYQEVRVRRKPH